MRITALVITRNEEAHIGACLSCLEFCDEMLVVDSGSTDETPRIAVRHRARVVEHAFKDYADQKNFGIQNSLGNWVLSIDADERVSEELKEELMRMRQEGESDRTAFAIPRRNIIFGKHLKYGANRKDAPVRFFRKDVSRFEGEVHEAIQTSGETGRLRGSIVHYSTKGMGDYLRKLNVYSDLEVEKLKARGEKFSIFVLLMKPFLRFIQRYIFQGGFRDGLAGLMFIYMSAYYEFIRYAKYWEYLQNQSKIHIAPSEKI